GRELLVLRLGWKAAMKLRMTHDLSHQVEAHRRQCTLPQLACRFAGLHETPVLRGDRARVHSLREVIDRASGDRIAAADRPLHRSDPAMTGKQRRVIANASE